MKVTRVKRTSLVYWYLTTSGGEERWVSMHFKSSRHKIKLIASVNEYLEPDIGSIYLFGSDGMNGIKCSFQFMAKGKSLEDYSEGRNLGGGVSYKVPLSAVTFELAREKLLDLGFECLAEAVPHLLNPERFEIIANLSHKIKELVPFSLARKFSKMGCVRSKYETTVREEVSLVLSSPRFISIPMGGMTRQMRELTPKK